MNQQLAQIALSSEDYDEAIDLLHQDPLALELLEDTTMSENQTMGFGSNTPGSACI